MSRLLSPCRSCRRPPARAEYPDRVVRIVVPVAAGGGVDVMARMLAQKLSERLGQQFVVENRPGAAGVIGSKAVIGSPADGYTLLYTPSSLSLTVAVNKTRALRRGEGLRTDHQRGDQPLCAGGAFRRCRRLR